MTRQTALSPTAEHSTEKTPTWRHPGGKLVELGAHTLKQDELLAILIGSGVAGRPALAIANSILDEYVGLHGIHRRATIEDLAKIHGLGRKKGARVLAAIELGRRLHKLNHTLKVRPEVDNNDLFSSSQPVCPPQLERQEPSDADLVAAIIGSGIRGRPPRVIAQDLLARFGSFAGLFGQDMGNFLRISGLNAVKIIRIAAAMEIARRLSHAIS